MNEDVANSLLHFDAIVALGPHLSAESMAVWEHQFDYMRGSWVLVAGSRLPRHGPGAINESQPNGGSGRVRLGVESRFVDAARGTTPRNGAWRRRGQT
jgi:hypothetical protein